MGAGTELGCAAGGAHAIGGLGWDSKSAPSPPYRPAPSLALTQPDLFPPLPLPISCPISCPPCCLWTLSRAVDSSHNKDNIGLEPHSSWSSVDWGGQQSLGLWASRPVVQVRAGGSQVKGPAQALTAREQRSRPQAGFPHSQPCAPASMPRMEPSRPGQTHGSLEDQEQTLQPLRSTAAHEWTHLGTWDIVGTHLGTFILFPIHLYIHWLTHLFFFFFFLRLTPRSMQEY